MEQHYSQINRSQIITVAREWIGTPYRHQCSVKGAGADCLGLLRGIYTELFSIPTEVPPPYRPDWYDRNKEDLLLDKAFEYLIPVEQFQQGDVLVFRMARRMSAKHCAVVSEEGRIIHARTGKGVEEVSLNHWLENRIVGSFSFPGVLD